MNAGRDREKSRLALHHSRLLLREEEEAEVEVVVDEEQPGEVDAVRVSRQSRRQRIMKRTGRKVTTVVF